MRNHLASPFSPKKTLACLERKASSSTISSLYPLHNKRVGPAGLKVKHLRGGKDADAPELQLCASRSSQAKCNFSTGQQQQQIRVSECAQTQMEALQKWAALNASTFPEERLLMLKRGEREVYAAASARAGSVCCLSSADQLLGFISARSGGR